MPPRANFRARLGAYMRSRRQLATETGSADFWWMASGGLARRIGRLWGSRRVQSGDERDICLTLKRQYALDDQRPGAIFVSAIKAGIVINQCVGTQRVCFIAGEGENSSLQCVVPHATVVRCHGRDRKLLRRRIQVTSPSQNFSSSLPEARGRSVRIAEHGFPFALLPPIEATYNLQVEPRVTGRMSNAANCRTPLAKTPRRSADSFPLKPSGQILLIVCADRSAWALLDGCLRARRVLHSGFV